MMKKSQLDVRFLLIDIVYTWVDDNDPKWQKERIYWANQYLSLLSSPDANVSARFRNREELRYSLRSVYQYARFVNHIYLVTCGQRPSWLKDDPNISIVSHEEIFPNKKDLPTFNSHAIEAHLHRIPHLSEKFLYFNDDVFLGREVFPKDFFSDDSKILLYTNMNEMFSGTLDSKEPSWISALKNTDTLLSKEFKKETRYLLEHAPFALTKNVMQEVEQKFFQLFQQVSSHKFRLPHDYALTNGLIQYYALYTGKAEVVKYFEEGRPIMDRAFSYFIQLCEDSQKNQAEFERMYKNRYAFFCIQDFDHENPQESNTMLQTFMMNYFSEPAPWEK